MVDLQKIDEIVKDLPMFDGVIQKIINMINREDTTAQKLENIIKEDAVLSLKIIKLANSAFFSPIQPITSIAHAVRYIGFSTIKSLVYSIALQSMQSKDKDISIRQKSLHEKLVVNAIITMMIGKVYLKENRSVFTGDDFYMFGLFHDIGFLAMASYPNAPYYTDFVRSLEIEKSVLKVETPVPHNLVGAKLMEKWEIPEVFRDFTNRHHLISDSSDKLFVPCVIVQLAEYFANHLGYDIFADQDLEIEPILNSINLKKENFFDSENQLTPVKLFVENLLTGFA